MHPPCLFSTHTTHIDLAAHSSTALVKWYGRILCGWFKEHNQCLTHAWMRSDPTSNLHVSTLIPQGKKPAVSCVTAGFYVWRRRRRQQLRRHCCRGVPLSRRRGPRQPVSQHSGPPAEAPSQQQLTRHGPRQGTPHCQPASQQAARARGPGGWGAGGHRRRSSSVCAVGRGAADVSRGRGWGDGWCRGAEASVFWAWGGGAEHRCAASAPGWGLLCAHVWLLHTSCL
jgi:hypothetical protein